MNFNLLIAPFAIYWISGKSFPAVTSKNKVHPLRMGFVFLLPGHKIKRVGALRKYVWGIF